MIEILLRMLEELQNTFSISDYSQAVAYGVAKNVFSTEEGFCLLLSRPEVPLAVLSQPSTN